MKESSRTENSIRNTSISIVAKILSLILAFATRVVFTHTLSETYVGINGLFVDILQVLSLSELGVGTAITYALYKPIAEEDIEKQKTLMRFYRNFYHVISVSVLVIGLMVIPFLPLMMKGAVIEENITVIYLLFLANTVLSYQVIYKRTLIDAHQKNYITTLYQLCFLMLQYVIQIAVLLTTHNFILYISTYLLCTVSGNVACSKKAEKMFPYLLEKNIKPMEKEDRKDIFKNIRAMMMHKVGNVIVNNTDNLLISAFVSVISVGSYSNYYLVIGSVRQLLDQFFQSVVASVGNLGVKEDNEHVESIFRKIFFFNQWVYGLAFITLFELLSLFVEFSFGQKYVFSETIVFVLCLNFYLNGMRQTSVVFKDSLGAFFYDRYKPIVEGIINLTVSLYLVKRIGIIGVCIGTTVSTVLTSIWVEPYVLYKYRFKKSSVSYFLKFSMYFSVTVMLLFLTHNICTLYKGSLFMMMLIRFFICMLIPNILMLCIYWKNNEFKFLLRKLFEYKNVILNPLGAINDEAEVNIEEKEKSLLLKMLKAFLTSSKKESYQNITNEELNNLIDFTDIHSVTPLIYDCVKDLNYPVNKKLDRKMQTYAMQSYHLLFISKRLIDLFERNNISAVVLKGSATASLYPIPEYRKSGDVDLLLLDPTQIDRVIKIISEEGYEPEEKQRANHHVAFTSRQGIEIEVHTLLAEPFDNEEINNYLKNKIKDVKNHTVSLDLFGIEIPALSDSYHAYHLLLHMLQHYLRAGFGIKLLCDWVVFWNRNIKDEEIKEYLKLVKESGLSGFSDMITSVCVRYLGLLDSDKTSLRIKNNKIIYNQGEFAEFINEKLSETFINDIFKGGEFGRATSDRMVMLRGNSVKDYLREFHHQMKLNYPKQANQKILWPVLWVLTLIVFLINNRKVRKTSLFSILKNARKRSEISKHLNLFTNKNRRDHEN